MKTNALGHEFKGYITRAVVGHYTQTPAELGANFLDLDRIATARAPTSGGLDPRFHDAAGRTRRRLPGIDDSGTWLVGLICGNCHPRPGT
jgi:hypothetical protein